MVYEAQSNLFLCDMCLGKEVQSMEDQLHNFHDLKDIFLTS